MTTPERDAVEAFEALHTHLRALAALDASDRVVTLLGGLRDEALEVGDDELAWVLSATLQALARERLVVLDARIARRADLLVEAAEECSAIVWEDFLDPEPPTAA